MKRRNFKVSAVIAAVMMLTTVMSAFAFETSAADVINSLKYRVVDDHIEITKCDNSLSEVVVPAEIDGKPVTSIYRNAFTNCSSIKSISIPDSVTSIGGLAFTNCSSLEEINVDENNKNYHSIDGVLFDEDSLICFPPVKQGNYSVPDSVKNICPSSFLNCMNLKSITLPNGVVSIGNTAFDGCSSLKSIIIPNSVTDIGIRAFNKCVSLEAITIKNPECKISSDKGTLSDTAVIYGYEGSTAQAYAEKYSLEFGALGDTNCDRNVNVADLVLFGRWLMNDTDKLTDWRCCDICADEVLDVYDIVELRKLLVE